ncbi:MAG TPA: TatD family hydrolase [Acidimicrobiia bacterium]|nr:TatD family hydrolase [Acidimicrobiia bacterium]
MTSADAVWIDAHCHLQFEGRGVTPEEAVARAVEAGVERMVCIGTDLATSAEAVRLAGEFPEVWASVGLHPHDASKLADEWDGLVELAGADRVVGIGEAGFDLYYRHSEPDAQEEAFRAQLRLAAERGLPLIIHSRDAWAETFGVLESEGVPPRTVFHCFTGGPPEAERALALGCWLSYSGIVSFKTADDLRAAAALTPADRLLIETDSPFLAPVPHRGKNNEPALLPAVGAAVAAARDEPVEAVAAVTRANALAFFWP